MKPYDIERALDAFAEARGFKPEDPHYISGEFNLTTPDGDLYSDEAHLWCEACADALLAKALPLISEDEREDHAVYRADPSTGEDTPSHCMACGTALDHVLTDAGVEYELDHYDRYPLTDISPAEAFCIARIVESAPDNPEVIALGLAALRAVQTGKIRLAQREAEHG